MVLQQDRDMIASLQSELAQQVRDLIRARLQLAIGDGDATSGHDESQLVRMCARVMGRMHDRGDEG